MATLVCCFSFALRALIFGSTTVLWNFMDIDDHLDPYIYPLAVYTLPDCLTSGAIITIMFDIDEASCDAEEDSAAAGHHDGESTSSRSSYLEYEESL